MSIITDRLPESFTIYGKECPIRTDFKTWIKLSEVMSSEQPVPDILVQMMKLVFYELPPNLEQSIKAIMDFYNPSKEKAEHTKGEKPSGKPVYDFAYDADLIFAAFMQQYNINLCESQMHWWQFKALFKGLTEDTFFIKVVQYRNIDLSEIKDKKQKKQYAKLKNLYKLPDNRSEKAKEEFMNDALANIF